ncbi:conserved hypothetical protein [Mycoplasmopsis pulmonis]|uniref:Ribosomal RNA small subunit methyltransferase E n=1 Tax=Mycoplasmopsis pulmonis (strain UAB CTIP) TaxID=272635 RepID=Q98Q27_MYCPU|nr:16S rRNA (uracil(1498)-N(3))-methyltransferase [Mycoplasmopsis pulmonis]MDZ7293654.1 16S rRNA (uracil(1498)-N(3))-methyltransferase [Mycoplasmopsis pulmonis]CAC13715.1 conserved hypothetical protein [Mycoplasmopsis pulmonis]VEU68307.1 RsmE family RNA methyltransferase [Mycoplasmopsis pulmonis]
MFRFFVEQKEDNYFILTNEILNHIKVARVQNKNFICIYEQVFYLCKLEGKKALIIEKIDANHEFKNQVILAMSVINTKRFELTIQKAAELGVSLFIPMLSQNVEQKLGNDIDKKLQRWKTIALNACEQSFRNKVMEITYPKSFNEVIEMEVKNKYIAHEKAKDFLTKSSFETNSLFLIGPEGGFSQKEIDLAQEKSFELIWLGKRILRAETAAFFVLSRINED